MLGEYGYLCDGTSLTEITERLADLIERQFTNPSTRCWVLVAMLKLVAQLGAMPEEAAAVCSKYINSSDVALAKYALEFDALAQNSAPTPPLEPLAHVHVVARGDVRDVRVGIRLVPTWRCT